MTLDQLKEDIKRAIGVRQESADCEKCQRERQGRHPKRCQYHSTASLSARHTLSHSLTPEIADALLECVTVAQSVLEIAEGHDRNICAFCCKAELKEDHAPGCLGAEAYAVLAKLEKAGVTI